jgi:hypothetical protein
MELIRAHFLSRWLCMIVALTIFNISVDTPDPYPDSTPENLSFNDIETVIEWLAETVFQIENAIPEHDDADDSHPLKVEKSIDLFFFTPALWPVSAITVAAYHKKNFMVSHPSLQSVTDEVNQPPEA